MSIIYVLYNTLIILFYNILFAMWAKWNLWLWVCWIFIILFNVILNTIIKIISEEPRPNIKKVNSFNDLGFPSGHSQLSAFVLFFAIYFCIAYNIKFPLLLFVVTLVVCSERYLNNKHTIIQIMYGILLGNLLAISSLIIYRIFIMMQCPILRLSP